MHCAGLFVLVVCFVGIWGADSPETNTVIDLDADDNPKATKAPDFGLFSLDARDDALYALVKGFLNAGHVGAQDIVDRIKKGVDRKRKAVERVGDMLFNRRVNRL